LGDSRKFEFAQKLVETIRLELREQFGAVRVGPDRGSRTELLARAFGIYFFDETFCRARFTTNVG